MLTAALLVPAALLLGPAGPATATAVPGHCGACAAGGTIAALEARIAALGRPTLCEVSHISPEDQGGTSTVEIMSFSSTKRCVRARSQGVLYLVTSESPGAARYLLALASVTPAFVDGWQKGDVAVLLGRGTSVLHQLQVYRALERHARFAFGGNQSQ